MPTLDMIKEISIKSPFTPTSTVSWRVPLRLGGSFLEVMVPPKALVLLSGSWFCQIHHTRSICPWCSQNAGSPGAL